MELEIVKSSITDLLSKAYTNRINDLKGSVMLAEKAYAMSIELGDKNLIADCLSKLSLFYMIMGENEDAFKLAEDSLRTYQELGNEQGMADAMYSMAGIYYKTDNFNLGLIYLLECLTIYKKFNDYYNMARVQKSMGTIYEYFGDDVSAIISYENSIKAGKKIGDENIVSNAYNPLSGIYLNQGNVEKAMKMIEDSIQMKRDNNDIRGLAFALYGRGKIYAKTGRHKLAEADYKKSIEIHDEMSERLGCGMSLRKLGQLYLQMEEYEMAQETITNALEVSTKYNIALIKFNCYYHQYELSKKKGKIQESLECLERYVEEKESVINSRTMKVIESYKAVTKIESLEKEAELQKEKAEIIEKKNLELDSFFYRVSHDLKGPITSLLGLDFAAREEVKDKTAIGYFDIFHSQVRRINNILDELIKITRMNHQSDVKQNIDFDKMIKDCISSYQYLGNFGHVKFSTEISDAIIYEAEWAFVNTIIQNLIENSIKYANIDQEEPSTIIKVESSDTHIHISIHDNGIGMDSETKDRIFEMFYQANSLAEGTGLGMYILSRAVEKLNGKMDVESEPGVGSKFFVTLPKHY